jgi:hypothetical protein
LKALSTGEARIDLSFPSGNRSEIRNPAGIPPTPNLPPGVTARASPALQPVGSWSGPDGTSHPIAQHNLTTDSAWFFPVFVLWRLGSSQGLALTHAGTETRGERTVDHVTVTANPQPIKNLPAKMVALLQHLSQEHIYLDSSTLLPVATTFNTHPDEDAARDIQVEIRFSDYRAVNGALVPYHVEKYANGSLILDLQFESVVLNTGLSASSFNVQ